MNDRPTLAERLQAMGRAALDAVRGQEPEKAPVEKLATIPVTAPSAPAPTVEAVFAANRDVGEGLRGVSKGTQIDVTPDGAQFARQTTPRPSYAPSLAQELAAGRGLEPSKQPEPAKERELERA